MRFVPTRVHGIADWLVGTLLVALPWLLGLDRGAPEAWLPMALGITGLLVTFFTDHELGVVRRIPMTWHLRIDALAGALLVASPWILGFSERIWVPHVVLGLTELVAAFVTKLQPSTSGARTGGASRLD